MIDIVDNVLRRTFTAETMVSLTLLSLIICYINTFEHIYLNIVMLYMCGIVSKTCSQGQQYSQITLFRTKRIKIDEWMDGCSIIPMND